MIINFKNQYFYCITLGLLIIAVSNILGHYLPPFSLMTTSIYMNVIVGVINYRLFKTSFNFTVIYSYFILLLNDYLLRKFAGGNHDSAGMAWCTLMFGITILISLIIMIVNAIILRKKDSRENKDLLYNLLTIFIGIIITSMYYLKIQATI